MKPGEFSENRGESRHRGLELFKVAGIQVAIDISWLVIFALVLWSLAAGYFPQRFPGHTWGEYIVVGLVATALFFASVLIHELAHAFVGNHLGEEVRRITLFIFGGMAQLSGEPRSPGAEFKIAAAGPLTSILLGAIFAGLTFATAEMGAGKLWTAVLQYLAFINVALAVFNLLPGYPLDGGRLLRAFFWHRSGDLQQATARAADWGNGIAIGLMVLGGLEIFAGALIGGLWLIFIAMFLRAAARAGYYAVAVEHDLSQVRVSDIMVKEPITLSPDSSVADAVDEAFLRYGFGGFPVGQDGHVEGLISLSAVQHCPPEERATRRVRDIMRPLDDAIRVDPDASVSEAMRRMNEKETSRLLVMDGSGLRGLITRSGIARYAQMKAELRKEQGR